MNSLSQKVGGFGQWLSLIAVVIGIAIEIHYKAHIGFVVVTSGSLGFAVFTKIKYYSRGR